MSTPTPTEECDVVVIGGGLAGTSAALAFARQGLSVTLFERRDMARDPNRGDILHPQTMAVCERLEILDEIRARGAANFICKEFYDAGGAFEYTQEMKPQIVLNHSELEEVFADAALAAGAVFVNEAVRSLVPVAGGWEVATDTRAVHARFLVGGDGGESLTRRTLGIGYADDHDYDNSIMVLHAERPAWLPEGHGVTVFHPEGVVMIFPTTPMGKIRIVMPVPRADAKGWMTDSEDEIARRIGLRHPRLEGLQVTKRGGSHVYRLRRTHVERYWGPRAALTGDAAHTTHTMGGQGLNIAIQDSMKLADLVGPLLLDPATTEEQIADALVEYEAVRRPINEAAMETAHITSRLYDPGEDNYRDALEFYGGMGDDPDFMMKFSLRFGGGE